MSEDTNLTQRLGAVIYWAHKLQRLVNRNLLPLARAKRSSRGVKAVNSQEAGGMALASRVIVPLPQKC